MEVTLTSLAGGFTVKSSKPKFSYYIKESGEKLVVPEEHAEKLLMKPDLFKKIERIKK